MGGLTGYWERRYAKGGDSGAGSRGKNARVKARRVNKVIAIHGVQSIIDWGCGDGEVLAHVTGSVDYIGVDISPTILERMTTSFPTRRFCLNDAGGETADLALSLDVLFHLPDNADYLAHLAQVFESAHKLVLIHSTVRDQAASGHVRHRPVVHDIARHIPGWRLDRRWPGVNTCKFLLYERRTDAPSPIS